MRRISRVGLGEGTRTRVELRLDCSGTGVIGSEREAWIEIREFGIDSSCDRSLYWVMVVMLLLLLRLICVFERRGRCEGVVPGRFVRPRVVKVIRVVFRGPYCLPFALLVDTRTRDVFNVAAVAVGISCTARLV